MAVYADGADFNSLSSPTRAAPTDNTTVDTALRVDARRKLAGDQSGRNSGSSGTPNGTRNYIHMTTGSTLPTSPEPSQAAAARLSAMLIGGGAAHFLAPRWFDSLIPSQLPGSPRMYTVGSSLANLAVGAGLAIPRTRRPASVAAALLFVGYMPAKLKLAIDWWQSERTPVPAKVLGIVQLFWQVPLVTESLKALRNAPRPAPP